MNTRQTDLFRDSPAKLAEKWRIAAETARQQFPNDKKRASYYEQRAEQYERQANGQSQSV